MCNFVYRGVPALRLARKLIRDGEIGEVYHFNAFYQQDFSLSPDFPFVWRMDERVAGPGILGDKGAHVIDMARFLVGELSEVSCCSAVFVPQRRSSEDSGLHKVTTDDAAVFIGRFENNALGMFQVSNMCAGKRNALILEIYGSRGGIRFDLERLNELEVYFEKDRNDVQGY
jgi:predicted dehydrogenase